MQPQLLLLVYFPARAPPIASPRHSSLPRPNPNPNPIPRAPLQCRFPHEKGGLAAAGGARLRVMGRKCARDALDKLLDKAVAAAASLSRSTGSADRPQYPADQRGARGHHNILVVPSSVPKGRCSEGIMPPSQPLASSSSPSGRSSRSWSLRTGRTC